MAAVIDEDGTALLARAEALLAEATTLAPAGDRQARLIAELAGVVRDAASAVVALQEAQRGWTRQDMSLDPPGSEAHDQIDAETRSWSRDNMAIDKED